MTQQRTLDRPHISTRTTDQLRSTVQALARRDVGIAVLVDRIRDEDDTALAELLADAQRGDSDGGTVALAAILPRLCAAVIGRRPVREWKTAVDEYVSLA